MVDIDLLPKFVCGFGAVIFCDKYFGKTLRERFIEINMPKHNQRIGAADGYPGNSLVRTFLDTPFRGFALAVLSCVVCLIHIRLEGVFGEVVVRRADKGIAKLFANTHKGRVVVARCVLGVNNDGYTKRIFEVEEVFLLITCDNSNVINARFFKLFDLSFNKHFSSNAKKALGLFVGNRGKARREASRHDDCIIYLKGRKRFFAFCINCAI